MPATDAGRGRWVVVIGAAVSVLAALGAYRRVDDPDLYWHLKVGESILAEHAVPRVDRYSHTFAGRPFPIIDWASEAVMAMAYSSVLGSRPI